MELDYRIPAIDGLRGIGWTFGSVATLAYAANLVKAAQKERLTFLLQLSLVSSAKTAVGKCFHL